MDSSLVLNDIFSKFDEFLKSEEGKRHFANIEREKEDVKNLLFKLRGMDRNDPEFTELVLYGLLPYSKNKYAKRISTFPAFQNIKQFFNKLNYTEEDWKKLANKIFDFADKFQKNPDSLETLIKDFTSDKYAKKLQCGSLSPILFCINDNYPVINNRVRKTYKEMTKLMGKKDELEQKLEFYTENIKKIKILLSKLNKKELSNLGIFDEFCFWYDEYIAKEAKPEDIKKPVSIPKDDMFEPEEEEPIQIEIAQRKVLWQPINYSIYELHRQFKKGRLHTQPEFQRFYVWDDAKASRLIESVLLNVPIPVIYLSEEGDSSFSVIDGQQRLKSFFRFLDNELRLRGLIVLHEFNDKTFNQLSAEYQDKVEKASIPVAIIKQESNPDIKFEIFERLNTGAVKLNDQELRNCIYRGTYNSILKELADDKDFQFLLGLSSPDKRMRDRELILRFFALYHNTHLRYKSPMKQFLNREMEQYSNLNDKQIKDLHEAFKKSVQLCKTIFNDNSFRRFVAGDENDPNGRWEKKVNKALFDILMFGFTQYDKNQVIPCSDSIREELIWLMTKDNDFKESITLSTGDYTRVRIRFDKWLDSLKNILGYPKSEPRMFSLQIKQQLFNNNPTCGICNQRIHNIDDAEVDHVEFYWRGGKTILPNARLTHRYCNRARGGG